MYRTLSPGKGISYSPHGNFFGEPDETIHDADNDKADLRRRELEHQMRVASSSKRRRVIDSSDDELVIKQPKFTTTPTKRSIPSSVLLSPPKPRSPFDLSGPTARPNQPALGAPFGLGPAFGASTAPDLPKPLADLLALHNAIESTLLLHLAASGALVASSLGGGGQKADDGSTTIRMPALIDLPDLAKKLASGGKRCTEAELAKLVWVWQGCGQSEHSDEDSDDELTVEKGGKGLEPGEAGGMGFIVSKMRVNGPTGIMGTYGVGLSVQVRTNVQRPKIELIPPPSPSRSPRRRTASAQQSVTVGGARDGMTIVALWTSGVASRRREFTRRLKGWLQRETDKGPPPTTDGAPPSPSRAFIPSVPLASLPALAHAAPTVPGTPSPSPHKIKPPAQLLPGATAPATPSAFTTPAAGPPAEGDTDVFGPVIITPKAKGIKGRRNAMMDRLRAKEAASASLPSVPLPLGAASLRKHDSNASATERRIQDAAALKKRSMLSRLPAVADVVWMLFDVGQKTNMRLLEAASAVAKSPGSGSSEGEAQEALKMLVQLCPGFLQLKVVGHQEWLGWAKLMGLGEVKRVVREELARSYPQKDVLPMVVG